jgi:hypothetical protein
MSEEERTASMGVDAAHAIVPDEPEPPVAPEPPPTPAPLEPPDTPTAPDLLASRGTVYRGNGYDITALIAAVTGLLAILSCATFGYMMYCLPLLPLALGLVGVLTTRRAADPGRSRVFGWIGLGTGALTTLILVVLVMLWFSLMVIAFVLPWFMFTSQNTGNLWNWGN